MSARKNRFLFRSGLIGASLLVCVGLLLFASQVHANNVSPSASSQTISAQQAQPSWVSTTSELNGKAVHFFVMDASYIQGSHGLTDGREVRGDIWELLSPDGQILAFHGIYTSPDGKIFYQEIFQSASLDIVILSKTTPGLSAAWLIAHQCILQNKPSAASLNSSLLPTFAKSAELEAEGFQQTTGVLALPSVDTPSFAHLSPAATFSASGPVQIWTKTMALPDSTTQAQRIEVSSQGRVLVASKVSSRKGTVISSDWTTFGTLYAYASSRVSPAIFSGPHFTGGCAQ